MPLTGPILMTFVVLLLGCNGPDVREPDPEPTISQSEVPDTGGADQPTVVPTVTEATFQFASTAAADLTGDGRTDTLRVAASGNDPMDIEVVFTIESLGRELLRQEWESERYFKYIPSLAMTGTEEAQYAHVREHLDSFFVASSFLVLPAGSATGMPHDRDTMDMDPVLQISGDLERLWWEDSLPQALAGSLGPETRRGRRQYPQEQRQQDAQDIWHQMIERDRVTFQVVDGVYTERLVWSQSTARFFGVWGCC